MLLMERERTVLKDFYVLEGLDGAGTTTQARRLAAYLGNQRPAHLTCEPTDFATGRLIRALLAGQEHADARTLALLFAADRNEHLERPETGIRARLAGGSPVVCDRYLFSSLAYQGSETEFQFVATLNAGFPLPEHLIYVDVSPELAGARRVGRGTSDRYERDDTQVRVGEMYLRLLDAFAGGPMRVHRIDGTLSETAVFDGIIRAVGLC